MLSQEDKRQLVHLSMVSFALLLRYISRVQAILLALCALFFNSFILFRIGKSLYREDEQKKGYSIGIILYPLTVLILVAFFPLHIAAGAWAILAFGDSISNIVGRRFGKLKLPWNEQKSLAGLVAFILSSIPSSLFFIIWVYRGYLELCTTDLLVATISSSAISGIIETAPLKIDDNPVVGLTAGVVLYLLLFF